MSSRLLNQTQEALPVRHLPTIEAEAELVEVLPEVAATDPRDSDSLQDIIENQIGDTAREDAAWLTRELAIEEHS